jgi:hypothetical protein
MRSLLTRRKRMLAMIAAVLIHHANDLHSSHTEGRDKTIPVSSDWPGQCPTDCMRRPAAMTQTDDCCNTRDDDVI